MKVLASGSLRGWLLMAVMVPTAIGLFASGLWKLGLVTCNLYLTLALLNIAIRFRNGKPVRSCTQIPGPKSPRDFCRSYWQARPHWLYRLTVTIVVVLVVSRWFG
jgi:hypothetical protein